MTSILNTELIQQRRLELGLGQRELARSLGTSTTAVIALEQGTNHHALTLRVVIDLAAALAITPETLMRPHTDDTPPTADDVRVEAALLAVRGRRPASHIARALGWRTSRVEDAAQRLAERCAGTGATLARTPHGLQIQPRPGVLGVDMPDSRTARGAAPGRSMSTLEVGILLMVSRDGELSNRQLATNARSVAIAGLRRLGYVEATAHGYRATDPLT